MRARRLSRKVGPSPSLQPVRGLCRTGLGAVLWLCCGLAGADAGPSSLVPALQAYVQSGADLVAEAGPGSWVYLQQQSDAHRIEKYRLTQPGRHGDWQRLSQSQSAALAQGGVLRLGWLRAVEGPAHLQVATRAQGRPSTEAADLWQLSWRPFAPGRAVDTSKTWLIQWQHHPWKPWSYRLKTQAGASARLLQADAAAMDLRLGNALGAALVLLRQEQAEGLNAAEQALLQRSLEALEPWPQDSAQKLQASLSAPADAPVNADARGHLRWGKAALVAYNRATAEPSPAHRALLEELGQSTMQDELGWLVRDRANLVLGYEALRQSRSAEAESALARVRSVGPYANAARLGLGWAQISSAAGPQAPGPAELRPRGEDATAEARRSTPFRKASGVASGHRAEALQRALRPWTDMIGADPLDPAVQEAMLAIPYALTHLGAHEDALERTQQALNQLQRLHQGLLQGQEDPSVEAFLQQLLQPIPNTADVARAQPPALLTASGGSWWRQASWPPYFYASRLWEQEGIRQQWKHCQNLQQVQAWLEQGSDRGGAQGVLHPHQQRLGEELLQCQHSLAQSIQQQLQSWVAGVQTYLNEARLSLARMHDLQAQPGQRLAVRLP